GLTVPPELAREHCEGRRQRAPVHVDGRERTSASWANEATSSSPAWTSPRPKLRPPATTGLCWVTSSQSSTRNGWWNQTVWLVTAVCSVTVESACDTPGKGRRAVPISVR